MPAQEWSKAKAPFSAEGVANARFNLRAQQGWRYLKHEPPRDLEDGEDIHDALPGKMAVKLQKLGLI